MTYHDLPLLLYLLSLFIYFSFSCFPFLFCLFCLGSGRLVCKLAGYLNFKMRGGNDKKGGHLEEIKKIEKNREERRVKMEEAKR